MKKRLLLLFYLIACVFVSAQEQITTFSDTTSDKDSNPNSFVRFNDKLLFLAESEGYGIEIWITDGTTDNATLLKDINPGEEDGITYPYTDTTPVTKSFKAQTAVLDGHLYFFAKDGTSDGELWKTDGTTSGTVKITNNINQDVGHLTSVNGYLYFFKVNLDNLELWKSDGTNAGTVLVKGDMSHYNGVRFQGSVNDTFIFLMQSYGESGSKIWRSDGTLTGTFPVSDELSIFTAIVSGTSAAYSDIHYTEFNNELYFLVRSNTIFDEPPLSIGLIKTDGTIENTVPVKAMYNGSGAGIGQIDYINLISTNDKIYFSFFQYYYNRLMIWESDGTTENTQLLHDLDTDFYFMCSNLVYDGIDKIIFTGPSSTTSKTALFSMSTLDNSLNEIKDLNDAEYVSSFNPRYYPNHISQVNNTDFFINQTITDSPDYQQSGWVSSLTSATTNNIPILDNLFKTEVLNEQLFFSKETTNFGVELWKSDLTEMGTSMIDNVNKYSQGFVESDSFLDYRNYNIETVNDKVIFGANDNVYGNEPRAYDNINGNTILLADINTVDATSYPARNLNGYVEYNGEIYFSAYDTINGQELWKTDGTEAGTVLVHDIISGTSSSNPTHLVVMDGFLYFMSWPSGSSLRLYKTDGTNLTEVKNFGSFRNAFEVITSNGLIYMRIITFSDQQLWVSDGTLSGTINIRSFNFINDLTDVNGTVFFSAREDSTLAGEIELWKTDGTMESTVFVKDIGSGYSSRPENLTALNDNLIFSAYSDTSGRELWVSDGTDSGTIQVSDIKPGSNSAIYNSKFFSTTASDFVLFTASDGINGKELWKTDGTASGTTIVKDINIGNESSSPNYFTSIDNTIYFQAYDNMKGTELWKTDGTESGTINVTDNINSGPSSSSPRDMIAVGDDLFFTAITETDGRQLWKIAGELLSTEENSRVPIAIYPNPTKNNIRFNTNQNIDRVVIYNVNGQVINEYQNITNNTISTAKLNAGFYIIEYELDGQKYSQKIIKI